jgi:hypothetical protein
MAIADMHPTTRRDRALPATTPAPPAEETFAVRRRPTKAAASGPPVRSTYTRGEILEAIRRWVAEHGAPPTSDDWDPARARRLGHAWRADRFAAGAWPSVRMVRRQFGTFGDALAEAGFAGAPRNRAKPQLSGREEVLRAIREWTRRYGEPPTQADWDPARARARGEAWREVRYGEGDWPSLITTRFHFGSLGAAIDAAGLERVGRWTPADERARVHLANLRAAARETATEDGEVGLPALAGALRAVAAARDADDELALRRSLDRLGETALRWSSSLHFVPDDVAATVKAGR